MSQQQWWGGKVVGSFARMEACYSDGEKQPLHEEIKCSF